MTTELLTWWLVLQLFGVVGVPLAAFLFEALPDRGYAFSKSLGLLVSGYSVWLLAMFGLGAFVVPFVLIVLVMLAVVGGLLLYYRWGWRLSNASGRLFGLLQRHWPGLLAYELLFVAAFIGLAWMRSQSLGFVGPHPWGTERPMDYAFFNAIRYSGMFPPPDPWLAGFSINYYYFGYLLMAMVSLVSDITPNVAYNLALATIFALTALGVAGVLINLIGLVQGRQEQSEHVAAGEEEEQPKRQAARSGWLRAAGSGLAALLGVVMVLLAGNQAGALQVIVGDHRVVALDGRQVVASVAQALSSSDQSIVLPHPAHTSDFETFETLERSNRIEEFNWWWPSRAVWDAGATVDPTIGEPRRIYNITEFPFFSFWLGDMHPHVMALPFNLLALSLVLATVARPTLPRFTGSRLGWGELLLTGIVLGSLYIINSWDLPTYVLLFAGALVLLYTRVAGRIDAVDWRALGLQLGLVVVVLYMLFVPFHMTFRSPVGFAEPLINLPFVSRLTQIIAPFVADKTDLHAYFIMFGLFLLPLLTFVYLFASDSRVREKAQATASGSEAVAAEEAVAEGEATITVGADQGSVPHQQQQQQSAWIELLLSPWPTVMLLAVGLAVGFPLLFLVSLGAAAFALALRRTDAPAERFVLLVIAVGCAICFGTELIYIRDVFNNRMNTVFKFYYQVWLLWGTVGAFAIWWLYATFKQRAGAGLMAVVAVLGLYALLLVGGLLYPAINLRDLVEDGTWQGLAGRTPREQTAAGLAGVDWLRENTPLGSVVLEMVGPGGGSYNGEGYAGIAASTGRPTVLGWYGHQTQWRGGDEAAKAQLSIRQDEVDQIYGTTDSALARSLLARYGVDYVYVGRLERAAYEPSSLTKFEELGTPVFQMDEVTIYQITQAPQIPLE